MTARERFRDAARRAGATLEALEPVAAAAPDGSTLAIDIAWIGARRPVAAFLHSSGLHGVEGFAGSAIQLALLSEPPPVPDRHALVLVHVLNPYGMAWLRRCNEHNVDLNRNFHSGEHPRDAPDGYSLLDGLINPPSPPRRDLFHLRAAYHVVRHGLEPLKQALAGGQYAYPRGLFYGGTSLEPGPAAYQHWLARSLDSVARLHVIDVHSGLGRWGRDSLVVHRGSDAMHELQRAIARPLSRDVSSDAVTYEIRGGYAGAFDVLPASAQVCLITQEFGTYGSVRVLHALREENRAHHHAGGHVSHPAKQRLKETFAPRSRAWRETVVRRGRDLATRVLEFAFAAQRRG